MVGAKTGQRVVTSEYGPDEVVERALPPMALLLFVVALPAAVYQLPGLPFRWQQATLFALEASLGLAAWLMGHRRPTWAAALLVVGHFCWAAVAEVMLSGSGWPFLCLAIACATALPWTGAPLLCGAVAPALLLALTRGHQPPAFIDLALVGLPLLGAVLYFTSRASRSTLEWSWRRHTEALKLSEALRERQGQLNRTVKALDLAYRLLQRTNHELAEARAEADEARRLKERFTANISHELRTPLNLILGFGEMMYVSPQIYGDVHWTKPLRQDVARIYEASHHLSQLVDDVLDLSRVQAERLVLHKEPCDLSEIARAAVETVAGMMRAGSVSLRCEFDPSLPRLELDGTRIRQVFYNMLSNAARFTDEGQIVLRTQRRDSEVLVSVQDTGVGIGEQELASIFDEFYQAEAASHRGGSGLGLAISRRIVQMHGGRIWAESTLGCGTTVYLSLPLDAAYPRTSRLHTSRPLPPPHNPEPDSVLLLNDQEDVAQLLERHLGDYRVACAGDGEPVDELVERLHPKALLLNLSPSRLDRLLAEMLPVGTTEPLPLLFCSIPSASWRAEALGVYASLRKPLSKEALLALLRGLGSVRDVVVIDDDQGFAQLLGRMLDGGPGRMRVRSAYGGAEGLAAMRERVPDVLLLDLLMPGMSGRQVLDAMRSDSRLAAVPVIVLTAVDVEDDLPVGRDGAVGLLQKGFWSLDCTLGALRDLVRSIEPHRVMSGQEPPGLPAGPPG